MRLLVVTSQSKIKLADDAFNGVEGVYQRVTPEKLTSEILLRHKPDILIADISEESIYDHDIVLNGIENLNYETIFISIEDDATPKSLRVSIKRQVKQISKDFKLTFKNGDKGPIKSKCPVWLVGASTGGPSVLCELFSRADPGKAAIVVALHIEIGGFDMFMDLLSERSQAKGWKLKTSSQKPLLEPGVVVVIHPDDEIIIGDDFHIDVKRPPGDLKYYPMINDVIRNLAKTIEGLGVVILTGIGTDGSGSINKFKSKLGKLIAQDNSAPMKYMPDACAKAGGVKMSIERIAQSISVHP